VFPPQDGYMTDLITRRSVEFISQNADGRLDIACNAPHRPFQPPGRPVHSRASRRYACRLRRLTERTRDANRRYLACKFSATRECVHY
jgi:hypothetical protein